MRQIESRLSQATNALLTPGIPMRQRLHFARQALGGQQINLPPQQPNPQTPNPTGLDQLVQGIAQQVADTRIQAQVPPMIESSMQQHRVPADRTELEQIIDGRIPAQPNVQQLQQQATDSGRQAAEQYILAHPAPSQADIANMVQQALGNIQQQPGGISEARVQQLAQDVFSANPHLSQQDVNNAIQQALQGLPGVQQQQVAQMVQTELAAHPPVVGVDETTARRLANEEITARAPGIVIQQQNLSTRRQVLYGFAGGVGAVVLLDLCGGIVPWVGDRIRGIFSQHPNYVPPSPTDTPAPRPTEVPTGSQYLSAPVETGKGNEVNYQNIAVGNSQYLLAQGWKINGTDGGVYQAIKGPTSQTLDITDGSYQIAGDGIAQQQFWSDIRTAMNNNWGVAHVSYDANWSVPSDLQQFLQGKDVKTASLSSSIARRQLFTGIFQHV